MDYKDKLHALRSEMNAQGINAFIVPRADEYQGEFVPPCAERLKWLSGFTGSAGAALVTEERAALLTDSRYLIQVRGEVDTDVYEIVDVGATSAAEWLAGALEAGQVIGFDPWLMSPAQLEKLADKAQEKDIKLKAVDNPVDVIWEDRPPPPAAPVELFPDLYAGRSCAEKLTMLAKTIGEAGLDVFIFTLPDSIAWLLNVRGGDIPCTPSVLSYAALERDGTLRWFVNSRKAGPDIASALGAAVKITPPAELETYLLTLSGRAVGLDFKSAALWFKQTLEQGGAQVKDFKDPSIAPKACKTQAEQAALKRAHIEDGAALVKFLHWLDGQKDYAALDELAIVEKLEECRRASSFYRGNSFSTIAGYGANGAIVHYRPQESTNLAFNPPGFLLLDSGGQYGAEDIWGTTDITRTIAIGEVSEEMKRHFTLVLKGHIAVASAVFRTGTPGKEIDALARAPLQAEGLDYGHGTGHGVGCYLAVHEEAASLSPKGEEALQPGMLISNEPGYYKEGAYGIRTENLVLVREGGEAGMLCFETVSIVPIDRRAIDLSLLDDTEQQWLNDYHAYVFEVLRDQLPADCRDWLEEQTQPL